MMQSVSRVFKGAWAHTAPLAVALLALVVAPPALAAAGCNYKVMNALNKVSELNRTYDQAVTEEILKKPDSVLAATCFNQMAGTAARATGEIFSGDMTSEIRPVVEAGLQSHYQNFATGTSGGASMATQLTGTFNCDAMNKIWQKETARGIDRTAPVATFNEMVAGVAPSGAGENYKKVIDKARQQGLFDETRRALDALPRANVPDFSAAKGSCDTLRIAGIIASNAPCK